MGTFKRTPFEIDTTVRNGSKYLNQMQFTGIVQNNNTYDVDQNSLTDALNVYVNEQNTLVSREPLIKDVIDINYPSETAELVDIKETNNVKVYVFKDNDTYTISAYNNDTVINISNIVNYSLSIFNQYIICWNEQGTKVINTSGEFVWKPISDFADVPITKIITGIDVETKDHNRFTNKYKEKYVVKEDLRTILPKDSSPIEVSILSDGNTFTVNNYREPDKLTELRTYRLCNYTEEPPFAINDEDITYHDNVVCIAVNDGFMISLDYGQNFIKVDYPAEVSTKECAARLSEDGRNVFIIVTDGVWRCDLSDYTWEHISIRNDSSLTLDIYNSDKTSRYAYDIIHAKFVNANVFMFVQTVPSESGKYTRLYFKAPGLYSNSAYKDMLDYVELSAIPYGVNVNISSGQGALENQSFIVDFFPNATIGGAFTCHNDNTQYLVYFAEGTNGIITYVKTFTKKSEYGLLSIYDSYASGNINSNRTFRIYGVDVMSNNSQVCKYYSSVKMGETTISNYSFTDSTVLDESGVYIHVDGEAFVRVQQSGASSQYMYDSGSKKSYNCPSITNELKQEFKVDQYIPAYNSTTKYYLMKYRPSSQSSYYIHSLSCTNLAKTTFDFLYEFEDNSLDTVIKKVPTLSYSEQELFLAFDNMLMITKNEKDGENILFNLPKINNQSFTSNIKAIINISTTELAIFFENGITICSKVADDSIGHRYDYPKTRLTLGTKFGDSVINTADGASTLYATPRGLAIMNYQAYMATTDQTLQFVSDKIYAIWSKFYLSSENITLIQHGDYVFVYNTTNQYLMLDLRNYSWWKFEIPFNIKKLLTDQIDLKVISDNLYKFKRVNNGTDKIEDDYVDDKYYDVDNEPIRWMFMSQRLHFNLPNHYKNMKQLVFHLVQSTGHISTFNAQIKLYRNSVNYKDMEVIPFDFNFAVDEFRTFVKRFNYWKINMLQYGVANDDKAAVPARLVCNGVDIKYEIGDEVR